MICKKCGAQLPENAKFCLECGTPVTDAEANQQTTSSVFDELQVEEIDSNSFFGQFENSPVEEVKPPKIEENPSVVESVNDSFSFQAEEVSDPFAITPDVTPSSKPVNNTLPNLDAENDIPINIPNPIPQTPISAAMPDLKEEVPSATGFTEQAIMNSGSVNQVTMGGMSSQIVDAPIPPEEPIVNPFQNNDNVEKKPDTIDDLLTDATMNPPPLNKSDNSFAQPNFDQYSVNMMYGSNTEEEQYLRMQKEQVQPAKAFDKATTPLPGAGSNVSSDFGNTYGNGLNSNTNINAYQNNMQKAPQMQQPQGPASKAKDPTKKKSPIGKVIIIILIVLVLGALGYIFYPYLMNFINSKKDANSVDNIIIRQPLSSNTIVTENTSTNDISNEVVNALADNSLTNDTTENNVGNNVSNEVSNKIANETSTANTINLNITSRNTVSNTITLTNSTTQH